MSLKHPFELSYPFEELISASSIIFYHCDLEENFPILFMSKNVKEILGFEAEAFKTDDTLWIERIHPEDRELVVGAFERAVREEEFSTDYRFRHKDGHYIWLYDEVKLVKDDDGNAESLVGSSFEITERKQAEQKLKELNETLEQRIKQRTEDLVSVNNRLRLLEMAVANIDDMVIITEAPADDPVSSKIVFVNDAFERASGYSEEEVKGKNPSFLHGPDTSREVLGHVERKIRSAEHLRVEFINYKKDGTPYWVELDMSPFPGQDDGKVYWVGINRNIDERKQTEQQLKREKEFIDMAINSLPGLFYVIDEDYNFVRTNENYEKELGYSKEELRSMKPIDFYPEEDRGRQERMLEKAFETDEQSVISKVIKKDGSVSHYLFTDKRFRRENKVFVIGTGIDISEQIKAEQKLKDSLHEKEILLAEIHHRVKNNLAIISGLLDLQAFNEENGEVIKRLRESQSRIQSIAMVHEKLYQSDSLSRIEMNAYVDQLVEYITAVFEYEETEITIINNADTLYLDILQAIPCGLILNELITNAYKHAFPNTTTGNIEINLNKAGDTVMLEVKDDGVGLPDSFDLQESESLGMTLIQTLVQQLEADYTLETKPGTAFSISFELSD